MKTITIYPGTFDPLTNGHLDIIERAAEIFSIVIVAVARNSSKRPLFTSHERVTMIRSCVNHLANVEVDSFEGLLVSYAKKKRANVIVRGLRAVSDFEYEFQMALTNRKLGEGLTTVYLMPHEKYTYLSSSLVREIATYGGDVSGFVPELVEEKLKKKLKKR
ncbi:MAG: pantetheine-phosphate adenylyltransferase [Bacteroidetes bacterium]|nr:MAG: pantetheine-phosphate adenylyltransferase [Bacteroidota bacterium]